MDPVLSAALLHTGLILFQFKEFPDMDTFIDAVKCFYESYDAIGLE